MKRSHKFLLTSILVVGFCYFIFQTISKSGMLTSINPIGNFEERALKTAAGIEDITVDQETNIAYLSAHDRRNPKSTGQLFSIDLKDSSVNIVDISSKYKLREFRPHGISFLRLESGRKFLFVISHSEKKHDVLRFEILGDTLNYLNKYSSTEFVSPNDILAVGENQFFLTNDHSSRNKWKVLLFDFLRIPTGNVVFFDGEKARVSSEKIVYPNGIALSRNRDRIFVASTLDKKIYVFEPQAQNHQLTLINEIDTIYPPDNIEINRDGKLIVGCHPNLISFMNHKRSESKHSPSAILEIEESSPKTQKTLYMNDGSLLSGSSVAAPYFGKNKKENLLVGSVFEKKILQLIQK